jgi:hypothetical protein
VLEIRLNEAVGAAGWDELVASSLKSHIYYRAAYLRASAELQHGQPPRTDHSSQEPEISLTNAAAADLGPDGQSWTDAGTPYPYGGVLSLDSEVTLHDVVDFFEGLLAWCTTRKLVSGVLRSHPLLTQAWLFAPAPGLQFVSVKRRSQTVAMPLQPSDDTRHSRSECRRGAAPTWPSLAETCASRGASFLTNATPSKQLRIFRGLYESICS